MRQWVASSLILALACTQFLPGCGSSDSTDNGGTGGTGNGTGGTTSVSVSCDMESWVGGDPPCEGSWTLCTDGKEYAISCTVDGCNCQIDGSTTKAVPVASLCTPTTTAEAVGPIVAACGFPL